MSQPWHQVVVYFDSAATAEPTAVAHLAPVLAEVETTGLLASWFFIRKSPCWRLRLQPNTEPATTTMAALLRQRLDALRAAGRITRWVQSIYEPETHAFGGPAGMDTAHRLFHRDSHHILTWLASGHATGPAGGDRRREVAMLLCSALLRAAGQDWYEQGDVWARVAEHRHLPPDTAPDRLSTIQPALRRLMTVDTAQIVRDRQPLAFLRDWTDAFTDAGTHLADLARTGTLRRGLRAVLTHHLLFASNRIGLSHDTQSLLAHAAKAVVLDQ